MPTSERALTENAGAALTALVHVLITEDVKVQAVVEQIGTWIFDDRLPADDVHARAIDAFGAVTRAEPALQLPDLPELLFRGVLSLFAGAARGRYTPISVTPAVVLDGRRPKNQGKHIERDVTWWYRTRLASPRARISELRKAYEAGTGRRLADAHSVVQNGIARADRLLAAFRRHAI